LQKLVKKIEEILGV
jgi:hypothetical protein